ncbi:hypothetical protein KQX54_018948 [Cotesia glomerata]|uniref:Uncharacterized protein n=1 Tax=Cotesia glomerata TaxID=32391 RepID=A0AAV7I298_COTGL|nr:hypothetical protein KQX54_018948 [Cotesia glomerata]
MTGVFVKIIPGSDDDDDLPSKANKQFGTDGTLTGQNTSSLTRLSLDGARRMILPQLDVNGMQRMSFRLSVKRLDIIHDFQCPRPSRVAGGKGSEVLISCSLSAHLAAIIRINKDKLPVFGYASIE